MSKASANQHSEQYLRLSKKDWNVLIILDACRDDTFREIWSRSDKIESMISMGGQTQCYMSGICDMFSDGPPVLYVTANPVPYNQARREKAENFKFVNTWTAIHRSGCPTLGIEPDRVSTAVLRHTAEGQPLHTVIHFLQPHEPFILEEDKKFNRQIMKKGRHKNWKPEFWNLLKLAYTRNARLSINLAEKLLPKLKGRVIVTADHGQLIGEDACFGHHASWSNPELLTVPWVSIGEFNDKLKPVELRDDDEVPDDEALKAQLEALGYG